MVVLNRTGVPGGLNRKQVEEALKMKVDVAIPDLPRAVGNAATLGEPSGRDYTEDDLRVVR